MAGQPINTVWGAKWTGARSSSRKESKDAQESRGASPGPAGNEPPSSPREEDQTRTDDDKGQVGGGGRRTQGG